MDIQINLLVLVVFLLYQGIDTSSIGRIKVGV
jgi:hypothetical protein